ncbi:hypothetical protein GCM10010278_83050 [Streptomyces melanogenes]|nr:hypothetical protein GCM10010278_83050 [Streptomyces melanogenes]
MVLLPPGPRLSFRAEFNGMLFAGMHRLLLPHGSLIEVVLHQLPQQLASQLFELSFQLVMRRPAAGLAASVEMRRSKASREAEYGSAARLGDWFGRAGTMFLLTDIRGTADPAASPAAIGDPGHDAALISSVAPLCPSIAAPAPSPPLFRAACKQPRRWPI